MAWLQCLEHCPLLPCCVCRVDAEVPGRRALPACAAGGQPPVFWQTVQRVPGPALDDTPACSRNRSLQPQLGQPASNPLCPSCLTAPPPPLPPLPQVGLGMTVREGPEEAASAAGGQQQEDTATSGGAGAAEPPAAAAAGSAPEPMQQDGAQPPAAAEPEPERSEEEWELLNK